LLRFRYTWIAGILIVWTIDLKIKTGKGFDKRDDREVRYFPKAHFSPQNKGSILYLFARSGFDRITF